MDVYVGGVSCLVRLVALCRRSGLVMSSQLIRLSVGLNQLFCAPTSLLVAIIISSCICCRSICPLRCAAI